ncbi:unnamed protein product [Ambrosiozyma monospora]|uniref:Unnamed protein product n=1 Tax=Ambrosiozyma monospora TaxID=43982 RepID=A0ACB5T3L6_AMBMO|nr:unnamed protein product [Ambrosiozyma monospora]
MGLSSTLTPFVQTVVVAQPPEVQCLIIKMVILNSHYLDIKEDYMLEKPLVLLISLIGYHDLLDGIVSDIIQELVFNESIFENKHHFEIFQNFIFDKSIKVKFSHDGSFHLEQDQLIKFLKFGCCEFVYQFVSWNYLPDVAQFATKIVCYAELDDFLFEKLKEATFFRLRSINLLMEAGKFWRPANELVKKMIDWRRSKCTYDMSIKKHLVVTVKFSVASGTESVISEYVPWLIELNKGGDFGFQFIALNSESRGDSMLRNVSSLKDGNKNLLDSLNFGLIKDNSELRSLQRTISSFYDKMEYCTGNNNKVHEIHVERESNKLIGVSLCCLQLNLADVLGNARSLCALTLDSCTIDSRWWSSLPECITLLNLVTPKLTGPESSTICLPSQLEKLYIEGTQFPKISNSNEMNKLSEMGISFNPDGEKFYIEDLDCALPGLRTVIQDLSPKIRSFFFSFRGVYTKIDKPLTHPLCFNSLSNFGSLEDFSFEWLTYDDKFPSLLPSMVQLSQFIGKLPAKLKSLNVELSWCENASLSDFWGQFIHTGLKELLHLTVSFRKEYNVDFTHLQFPPNLLTIELIIFDTCCYKYFFDRLPSSLIYIKLFRQSEGELSSINVSNIKTMSFDQLKKLFILKPAHRFEWITDQPGT